MRTLGSIVILLSLWIPAFAQAKAPTRADLSGEWIWVKRESFSKGQAPVSGQMNIVQAEDAITIKIVTVWPHGTASFERSYRLDGRETVNWSGDFDETKMYEYAKTELSKDSLRILYLRQSLDSPPAVPDLSTLIDIYGLSKDGETVTVTVEGPRVNFLPSGILAPKGSFLYKDTYRRKH